MASSEIEMTNDILMGIVKKIVSGMDTNELDFVSIKGEIMENGKVKNTITFTGDYADDGKVSSEIKTGDKLTITL